MLRSFMDPPVKYDNPRRAGIVPAVAGALMLGFNILSLMYARHYYPWVFVFGSLGFSYGLWVVVLGVPRDKYGEPLAWWAYTGFAFWVASTGVGVWLGFFFFD